MDLRQNMHLAERYLLGVRFWGAERPGLRHRLCCKDKGQLRTAAQGERTNVAVPCLLEEEKRRVREISSVWLRPSELLQFLMKGILQLFL